MTGTSATPKAFISYSWSTLDHQQWVMDIATRLIQDGVDVALDKWDLREGGDKFVFMEKMVSDPEVTKVLIVCDKVYKDKADNREGGVGTESTILTPDLYSQKKPNKFAALVVEKDEDGNAYTPAFWAGRVYIDFSESSQYEDRYEQLLRWCLDKPLNVKPALGKIPDFIVNPNQNASETLSKFKRADSALREGKPNSAGLVKEYLDLLIEELKKHGTRNSEHEFIDDAVIASINEMRPYARQLADIEATIIRYLPSAFDQIISTHEKMGRLMFRSDDLSSWNETDHDPYEFTAYESFLRFIAVILDEGRYDLLGKAVSHAYYIDQPDRGGRASTSSFAIFGQYVRSFENRKRRLNSNRIDIQADIVHEGNQNSVPSFEKMMEADFVLLLCNNFNSGVSRFEGWYPRTLIYAARSWKPFPLFARSESLVFFKEWSGPVLNGISIDRFKEGIVELEKKYREFGSYSGLGAGLLANVEYIGTKP